VTGRVFKAPALKNGGALLATGKQYASIVIGQDMTTGFIGPIGDRFESSISESLALPVKEAASICMLREKA